MRRREFLGVAVLIAAPIVAEYAVEAATKDPYSGAKVVNPTWYELLLARTLKPLMDRFATSKNTHGPDWTLLPYLPNFKGVEFTPLPGDPDLKSRRHGVFGLIDSITISLGAWPNKIDLTPDRFDQRWQLVYREGIEFVKESKLSYEGVQSVIQGDQPYEIAGIYEDGSQVHFSSISEPNPRTSASPQTHLV
jgi:hypothetical protein